MTPPCLDISLLVAEITPILSLPAVKSTATAQEPRAGVGDSFDQFTASILGAGGVICQSARS